MDFKLNFKLNNNLNFKFYYQTDVGKPLINKISIANLKYKFQVYCTFKLNFKI
jgi:hypothetical protein